MSSLVIALVAIALCVGWIFLSIRVSGAVGRQLAGGRVGGLDPDQCFDDGLAHGEEGLRMVWSMADRPDLDEEETECMENYVAGYRMGETNRAMGNVGGPDALGHV